MGKVILRASDDVPFVPVRQAVEGGSVDERSASQMRDATKDTQDMRVCFEGNDNAPSLVEVRCSPDKPAVPHAHLVDEIVYVLEGELVVGNRHYGPGSAIYVPAETLYSFHVGPQGVRYLNFRPRRDDSYVSKDDFMTRRKTSA